MDVWVRKEHVSDFCKAIGEDGAAKPALSTRSWVNMQFDEVNYGAFDERLEAGKKGLIFFGTCSPGDTYDGEVYYSDGREMHSQDAGVHGHYIVPMENGKVKRGATAAINKFDKAWKELHEDMRKELVEQSHEEGR
jgi:hypothetical protein